MAHIRLLAAACFGTLFYVLVSVLCGRNSLWAQSQMEEQRRILSMHTAEIEKTNEELNLEKVALEKDMDVIAAYARKLSYINEGEKIVKITGLSYSGDLLFDAGTVLKHTDVRYFPEWFCKTVGIVIFSLAYFVLLVIDESRMLISSHKRRSSEFRMQGQPV